MKYSAATNQNNDDLLHFMLNTQYNDNSLYHCINKFTILFYGLHTIVDFTVQ